MEKKHTQPLSSQQTSMSGCNAKRDTRRIGVVRRTQGNLSRYHRPPRKTRLLAVSVSKAKSDRYCALFTPPRASSLSGTLSTNVRGSRGMPGQGRGEGARRSVGTWRRAFVGVFMPRFFLHINEPFFLPFQRRDGVTLVHARNVPVYVGRSP